MTRTIPLAMLLLTFLPGCTAISALTGASRPLEVYELRTPAIAQATPVGRGVELIVEEPVASGALASERIMIRPSPLQAQYLPDVRWSDTAPIMLQTLIVRSLLETGALGSVGRRPLGAQADLALLSELTDFQAEIVPGGAGATVRLRLVARLVDERDARVIATRTFVATGGAPGTDANLLVPAFDRAAAQLLSDLVPWILGQVARGAG